MTKVVQAREMAKIELKSYQEGCSEEQFMRNAGARIAEGIQKTIGQLHIAPHIVFLCGKGNNGGDGFVSAKHIADGGFSVQVYALAKLADSSPLNQKMRAEFKKGKLASLTEITSVDQIKFEGVSLIIDALLGTGVRLPLPTLYQEVIRHANRSKIPILSVDIPSGVNGTTGERAEEAIVAHKTFFLGLPKSGCFLGEAFGNVGEVVVYDFGIPEKYVEEAEADFLLVQEKFAKTLLPPLYRMRHKYQAGYVVGIGGSLSMPGAPLLASEAALRTGAGIVRLLHPEGMQAELSHAPFELIRQPYKEGDIDTLLQVIAKAGALFIGPGMGKTEATRGLLEKLLPKMDKPCVMDADALNDNLPIPKGAVLTPHRGEMRRLLHLDKNVKEKEFLALVKEYANRHQVTVVLKGAPTFIFHMDNTPYIVARGDCGMATAGSGDVLTGIIAALLAQGKSGVEAAILGVYLHAVAGERAAKESTSYGMIASDITHNLSGVFKALLA